MGLRILLPFVPAAVFAVSSVYFSTLSVLGPAPADTRASRRIGTTLAVLSAILCALSLLFAFAVLFLASLVSAGGGEVD
jgi:hypothetical protein